MPRKRNDYFNHIKYTPLSKQYHAALYIRLSREDGDKSESDSIFNQRLMLNRYIQDKEEFQLYDTYIDDGYSGTNFDRPSFKRMIVDIEAGNINCVIVKDLSRFGRDYIDVGNYIEKYFDDKGIRFIAVGNNIDTLKEQYDIIMPILNVMNQRYAKDISRNVSSVIQIKQKDGQFIGSFACYGYMKNPIDKHKLIIDEEAAQTVKRVFDLFIQGKTKQQIAFILNSEGVLSPSAYKIKKGYHYKNGRAINEVYAWSYNAIHEMLNKEMYIGNMVQHVASNNGKIRKRSKKLPKEEYIIVQGTHEPIISKETWEKTQNLLKRDTWKSRSNPKKIYPLSGFIRCGDCGKSMVKVGIKEDTYYYCCASYRRYGKNVCTKHTIRADVLEKIILNDVNTCIGEIEKLQEITEQEAKNKTIKSSLSLQKEIERIKIELTRAERVCDSLYDDYKNELITKDEYQKYKKSYTDKIDVLKNKIQELSLKAESSGKRDCQSKWVTQLLTYKKIDYLDRKSMVDLVNSIRVYENNEIEIEYTFSKEFQNLMKKEYKF